MVEQRICTFCGKEIEPGTGKMYVKKDGTFFLFCTNKCQKNMIGMKRVPRKVTWTRAYAATKARAIKIEKDIQTSKDAAEAKALPPAQ
jgi:large subunit ribosomal protein L24e